jgi:hypothetical protein
MQIKHPIKSDNGNSAIMEMEFWNHLMCFWINCSKGTPLKEKVTMQVVFQLLLKQEGVRVHVNQSGK